MAEGAPLLREYGLIAHRGFESLSLRQLEELLQTRKHSRILETKYKIDNASTMKSPYNF